MTKNLNRWINWGKIRLVQFLFLLLGLFDDILRLLIEDGRRFYALSPSSFVSIVRCFPIEDGRRLFSSTEPVFFR
jgi:hypothetical protein